jgi:hypothetical protein
MRMVIHKVSKTGGRGLLALAGLAIAIIVCGCEPGSLAPDRPGPVAADLQLAKGTDHIPAKLIDLSCWKLTLPVDTERPGTPDEILQPELAGFSKRPYFHADSTRGALILRAPCGGVPTKGSNYPRCELREMNADGRTPAAWGIGGDTVHVLVMRAAVTAVPAARKHLVVAQIHDARNDVLMIRLESPKFIIERSGQPDIVLEPKYRLGDPFELRIEAGESRIAVWWNGDMKLDEPTTRPGCYFKAGCYTQSNPDKGDSAESFGEVAIYELQVGSLESAPPIRRSP